MARAIARDTGIIRNILYYCCMLDKARPIKKLELKGDDRVRKNPFGDSSNTENYKSRAKGKYMHVVA